MAAEFELLRHVTIGQYYPTGSIVHRLDPRVKILGTLFIVVAISVSTSILASLALLLGLMFIARVARIPFSSILRSLQAGAPILAFFLLLQLLFVGWRPTEGPVYIEWQFIRITRDSLQLIALGLVRIVSFFFIASLPTLTATPTQLTHGLELMMRPLRRLGLPATELALINMIALRFVPTLAEELERIIKTQASRGANFGAPGFQRPDRLARALLPLVVPLFVNSFRRAEELALAMDARCYSNNPNRTKFVVLRWTWLDSVAVVGLLVFCAGVILIPWPALHSFIAGL